MQLYRKLLVDLFILLICNVNRVHLVDNNDTFLYFAYGSNLLARRIHINNPTATFFSAAKLPNYRLDFNMQSKRWNGAAATIVEESGSAVWGALWTLNISDMSSLDKQEGVDTGMYYPKNVTVLTREGVAMDARVYQESVDPPKILPNKLPIERQPSDTYFQVIIYGAYECFLPIHYLRYLFNFPTNGKLAPLSIRQALGYPFNVTDE